MLVLQLYQRVERVAGRLLADALPQGFAGLGQRVRQHEGFGNALDGKALVGEAGVEVLAVQGGNRHGKLPGAFPGQRRDVVCRLAGRQIRDDIAGDIVDQLLNVHFYHRCCGGEGGAGGLCHPAAGACRQGWPQAAAGVPACIQGCLEPHSARKVARNCMIQARRCSPSARPAAVCMVAGSVASFTVMWSSA